MTPRIEIARNVQNYHNGSLVLEITTANEPLVVGETRQPYVGISTRIIHIAGPNGETAPGIPTNGPGVTFVAAG